MQEEMQEYKIILTWEAIYNVTDITAHMISFHFVPVINIIIALYITASDVSAFTDVE